MIDKLIDFIVSVIFTFLTFEFVKLLGIPSDDFVLLVVVFLLFRAK